MIAHNESITKELTAIALEIEKHGGDSLLVGGSVRDMMMGRVPKDYDVEVFGLSVEKLNKILSRFGKTDLVGKAFGIVKVKAPSGNVYDFSLPRRESKYGSGHKGFDIQIEEQITVAEAAERRDLTFNSMSRRILTGELIDPFGGERDLKDAVLRRTSHHFVDDPLRPLRVFQMASWFRTPHVTRDTMLDSISLIAEYDSLPPSRIWDEWEKWALRSVRPSNGLLFLKKCAWIVMYPELAMLIGLPQDPEHHPEGDVWNHTLYAVDAVADMYNDNLVYAFNTPATRLVAMFAALLHDVGKAETTEYRMCSDGNFRYTTYNHHLAGVPLAKSFLERIGAPNWVIDQVLPLVREHMAHVFAEKATPKMVNRLVTRLHPALIYDWFTLTIADHAARPPLPARVCDLVAEIVEMAGNLGVAEQKPDPLVKGRHLIQFDIEKPGVRMGELLADVFEHQLDGSFTTISDGLEILGHILKGE